MLFNMKEKKKTEEEKGKGQRKFLNSKVTFVE